MYDVKTQVIGRNGGKAHVAHRGHDRQAALDALAYYADVPEELGTVDIVFSDNRTHLGLEWHMWVEEDGIPRLDKILDGDSIASCTRVA